MVQARRIALPEVGVAQGAAGRQRRWWALAAQWALIATALVAPLAPATAPAAVKDQGLAMRAEAKYKPGSPHYEYANAQAPKGGTLVIGVQGTMDSLNPYSLKGVSSSELERLVFQELGEPSLDEPFTQYPALAESFEVAADQLSMIVRLRPNAAFADGTKVTAKDIVFSFKTFRTDQVPPFYRYYWEDVKEVVAVDDVTAKFVFTKLNPELPLTATQLPILPEHIYGTGAFATDFANKAVGSGPYTVADFRPGASLTLKRNPKFWGSDVPFFRGRFNFDDIVIKFYKDPTAMVEGFKKGDFDVYNVNSAKIWALELKGDKVDSLKYIKKDLLPNANDVGAQGFVFNLRLPIFQDVRVRQALALAFDFEWSNKNLFYDQYVRNESYFENSPLKAKEMPNAEELGVLTPLKGDLSPEVFTKPMGWLDRTPGIRDRLTQATQLLKDAGYVIKDGVAQGPGGRLEFKFLLDDAAFQRVVEPYLQNLRKLGVRVTIEEKEQSVYLKRIESRQFDMVVQAIPQSQSPGNEQRDFWSAAAGEQSYSRNYAGIKNKAVDALVDRIIYAKSRTELELMTRCLDRVLYHLHPMVLHWHLTSHRFAHWDKFGLPGKLPTYYSLPLLYEFMWYDAARAKRLEEARAKNAPLL